MSAGPETPEETEGITEGVQKLHDNVVPPEPVEAELELPQAGPPWKKIAIVLAGVVVIGAGAAMATLAATHKSAVLENAKAYVNGLVDGYSAASSMALR